MVDEARQTLIRLSGERRESLAELSRMLRRNPAYLQQFLYRGTPRRLAEDDRRLLAMHFAIGEERLGGAPVPIPDLVSVPYLSVRAAAGAGLSADDERLIRAEPFASRILREAGITPAMASLAEASGDSMAPGILDGDRLVVDRGDRAIPATNAIFVFRRDREVAVKRLSREASAIRVASDNPEYPTIVVESGEIELVGRVKLLVRKPW